MSLSASRALYKRTGTHVDICSIRCRCTVTHECRRLVPHDDTQGYAHIIDNNIAIIGNGIDAAR